MRGAHGVQLSRAAAPLTPPTYDYRETVRCIDELDETICHIRHALHLFNAQMMIPDEGTTVDEALIQLAQMNGRLRRLERLRDIEPTARGYATFSIPFMRECLVQNRRSLLARYGVEL